MSKTLRSVMAFLLCLLLVTGGVLPSAAAGDPAAVAGAIDAIGLVTYRESVRTAIEQAEAAFAALSADEQAQVQNADVLTSAREQYNALAAVVDDIKVLWSADVTTDEEVGVDGAELLLDDTDVGEHEGLHWVLTPENDQWSTWVSIVDVDTTDMDFSKLKAVVSLRRTGGDDSVIGVMIVNAADQKLIQNLWYNPWNIADGQWTTLEIPFDQFETNEKGVPWPTWDAADWHLESPLSQVLISQSFNHADTVEIDRIAVVYDGFDDAAIAAMVDAANAVNDQIAAIGAVTSADQEEAVTAARAAYDALGGVQRLLVVNEGDLQQAEKTLRQVKAAAGVINAIAAIGEVTAENYRDKADPIAAAQELYDNFIEKYATPDAVTNADVLRAAKEAYDGFVAAEHPAVTFGDINGDEAVNAADALLALQHSVKLITLEGDKITAADVSGDGAVNAADALLVLQYSVKLIDKFPVEG